MTKNAAKPAKSRIGAKPKAAKPKPRAKPALFITAKMLREHDACKGRVRIFRRLWPNGARATLANCKRAQKAGLSLEWAALYLLSPTAEDHFNKIMRYCPLHSEAEPCPACVYVRENAPRAFAEAARVTVMEERK